MIDSLEAVVLGAIQGLTEFLPVSSSGHLVIAQHLFGLRDPPLLFDLLLHGATLLAVVAVLRRQVGNLFRAALRLPGFLLALRRRGTSAASEDPDAWTVLLILVTTAVTGGIGVLFNEPLKGAFGSIRLVSGTLILTGLLLFLSRNRSGTGGKSPAEMTIRDALWIGLAQGCAILPGLSRSGTTIAAALFLGLNRKFAGEYSFLVSLPAIAGAIVLEGRHGFGGAGIPPASVVLGLLLAFGLGIASLKLLLGWIRSGRLAPFAYYCWAVGLFAAFLSFR